MIRLKARDPRWGRNGEAGAEDPYLMSTYVDYVCLAVYIPPSRYVYNIYIPCGWCHIPFNHFSFSHPHTNPPSVVVF